jgi:hypothetical protein
VDDRFVNPFAKVRQRHPDKPGDRALILRYVRHHEPDPIDAEHLALGIGESIRDGELGLTSEDDVMTMRTVQGDTVTVAVADLSWICWR